MAEEEQVFTEVMSLLEAEPSSGPAGGVVADLTTPGPDIPALCEQLAVLVSTGKAKDASGVQLTHEQVKRLSDKDVEKYTKRYETYVGAKTTDRMNQLSIICMIAPSAALSVKNCWLSHPIPFSLQPTLTKCEI